MWHLKLAVSRLTTVYMFLAMLDTSLADAQCADPEVTYKKLQLYGPHDKTGTWDTTFGNIKVVVEHTGTPLIRSLGTGNWEVSIRVNSTICGSFEEGDSQGSLEESSGVIMTGGVNGGPQMQETWSIKSRQNTTPRNTFHSGERYRSWPDRWRTEYHDYGQAGFLRLFAESLPWKQAKERCEEDGAQLATVDTPLKVEALLDIFSRNPRIARRSVLNNQVYVGINDIDEEGVYRTVAGEMFRPWNSSVWMPGEPDDTSGGEDCVTFHTRGRIRDVPCHFNMPFFCELRDDSIDQLH